MKRLLGLAVISLGLLVPGVVGAKPAKEVPRKGKPADQPVLTAPTAFVSSHSARADGDVREWYDVEEVKFATLLSGEYDYDWTGENDLSGTLKTLYTDTSFNMYIQVKDNYVVDKLRQWKSDKVEVWLMAEDANGKPMGKLTGVQFDIGPVTKQQPMPVKILSGKQDSSKVKGVPYVYSVEDGFKNYDLEIAVDYSLLAKESPVYGGGIRYCVLIRDWDQDDGNEDEATVGTCPINPSKPSSLKQKEMALARLDLERIAWNSILGSDAAIGSKAGEWVTARSNVAWDSTPENIYYLDNQFVIWGFAMSEQTGLSWTTMSLNGQGTDPKFTFSDVDGDKLNEIILTRREACAEPDTFAERAYVFDHSEQFGLRLGVNYLVSVTGPDGKKYTNKFQNTKKGIVQTMSGGTPIDCTLDYSDDMLPLLVPGDDKKRVINL